jgi:tetratricopeptide (TPR) repeat protein
MTRGSRTGRRTLALVTFAFALALVAAACGGKSETQLAADELAAGLTSDNAGNQADASTHYLACLKHEPTNKYCLYDLGHIAQTQNQTSQAENYYRQALVQDPNFPAPIFNLAILRTGLGDTAGAIALYKQYVQLNPTDAGGHLNLGLLLRATGDQAGAALELAAAIKLNPKLTIPPLETQAPSAAPSAQPSAVGSGEPSAAPSAEPSAAAKTYTVVSGDRLTDIAAKFGTTVAILEQLNGIGADGIIHVGDILKLP